MTDPGRTAELLNELLEGRKAAAPHGGEVAALASLARRCRQLQVAGPTPAAQSRMRSRFWASVDAGESWFGLPWARNRLGHRLAAGALAVSLLGGGASYVAGYSPAGALENAGMVLRAIVQSLPPHDQGMPGVAADPADPSQLHEGTALAANPDHLQGTSSGDTAAEGGEAPSTPPTGSPQSPGGAPGAVATASPTRTPTPWPEATPTPAGAAAPETPSQPSPPPGSAPRETPSVPASPSPGVPPSATPSPPPAPTPTTPPTPTATPTPPGDDDHHDDEPDDSHEEDKRRSEDDE